MADKLKITFIFLWDCGVRWGDFSLKVKEPKLLNVLIKNGYGYYANFLPRWACSLSNCGALKRSPY